MKVGKANYGGGKTTFKIKDGDNLFRILPPLGNNADIGKWYEYYRVEWGYKNSDGRNKPFLDVRKTNFQTKMVEVESAAHLRREALKAELMQLKADLKAGKATKEQVDNASDLTRRYNLDAKYYMNAVDAEGKIGLLKLNSSFMKLLRAEIDKSRKAGKDPLAVENGMYFNFHRSNATGLLQDWTFSVTPLQREVEATINGQTAMVKQNVLHTMDESFLSRLSSEAFELSNMYPTPTAEQVERMVKEGVPAIDEILGNNNTATTTIVVETSTESKAEIVKEEPVTATATETVSVEQTQVNTAPANTATTTLSDADFLASIGANS